MDMVDNTESPDPVEGGRRSGVRMIGSVGPPFDFATPGGLIVADVADEIAGGVEGSSLRPGSRRATRSEGAEIRLLGVIGTRSVKHS
jgi:hypothetical protein